MTREEAITNLNMISVAFVEPVTKEQRKLIDDTFDMAIQALSQEPTEKPMTVDEMEREYEKSKALFHKIVEGEDAISRDELLKAIDTWDKFGYTETGCFVREPKGDYVPYIHYDDVIKSIKGMPSVTQKSETVTEFADRCRECGKMRKGHWISGIN